MSARSRQAWQLARLLTEHTGARVAIEWHGTGRDRHYSGWRIAWVDGPTPAAMAAYAAELARRFPAIDVDELRYDRGHSDLAETAALLQHLEQSPELAGRITPMAAQSAWEATEYPERLDEPIQRRARALLAHHDDLALAAVQEIAQRGHAGGWDAIAGWLAAPPAGGVIDLHAERTARRP